MHQKAAERTYSRRVVPVAFCCLEIVYEFAPVRQKLLGNAATQDTCASQTTLGLTCYVVKGDLAHC